jgi:predicted ABC-type ATPase
MSNRWDESKHPRDPEGTDTGGRFTKAGAAARKAAGLKAEAPKKAVDKKRAKKPTIKKPPKINPRKAGAAARKAANLTPEGTMGVFRRSDGSWDPERQKLHKKIIDSHFEGKKPVSDPQSFIMGGGPGAGKSFILRTGVGDIPDNHILANSDNIKAMLPEYDGGAGAPFVHEESSYLSKAVAKRAADEKYNIVMDGTGDNSLKNLTKKVKMMGGGERPVTGIYVTVDVETAVARSIARTRKTGRSVPEAVVRVIHASVSKVLPQAMKVGLFESVELYSSNFTPSKLIAKAVGSTITVLDSVAYNKFVEKGQN